MVTLECGQLQGGTPVSVRRLSQLRGGPSCCSGSQTSAPPLVFHQPPPPVAGRQPHGNSLFDETLPLEAASAVEPSPASLCRGQAPSRPRNVSSLLLGFPLPAPSSILGNLCVWVCETSLPSLRDGSHSEPQASVSGPFAQKSLRSPLVLAL